MKEQAIVFSWRTLFKTLHDHDSRFRDDKIRGKGSHRMLVHPDIDGKEVRFPVPVHSMGKDLPAYIPRKIMAKFRLPRTLFYK